MLPSLGSEEIGKITIYIGSVKVQVTWNIFVENPSWV